MNEKEILQKLFYVDKLSEEEIRIIPHATLNNTESKP